MTDHKLSGIPETMLIPLWARAVEANQAAPIIMDRKAGEMLSRIDYDFEKFSKSRMSQIGVCVRTQILDNAVSAFLAKHPDAVVVNLGAGLDTRFERLGPDKAAWYEVDVPEGIELRKKFFKETEQYRFIAASIFDQGWMNDIAVDDRPVLLIAEGLLMYFEEAQIRALFASLAEQFSGAEMLLEMLAPFLLGKARQHDSLKTLEKAPEFKWSLMHARELETFHPNIAFVEQWNLFDYHKDRSRLFAFIACLPFLKPRMAQRIVHLRFNSRR